MTEELHYVPGDIEQDEEETPVVFRMWPKKEGGGCLALFPSILSEGYHISSYEHVGQHGGADYYLCIQATRPAKPEEYAALKRELEGIGYRLKVYQKGAHLLPWRKTR